MGFVRISRDVFSFGLTLFVLLLVSVPVMEFLLRNFSESSFTPGYLITHPTRHYSLKPGFSGKTYQAHFSINQDGIREDENPVAIREGDFRIAVFGDSLAFGPGVPLEQTFPKQLEAMLNRDLAKTVKKDLPQKHFRVYDFAVPGYNFVNSLSYFEETYAHFKPDLVIFEFSLQNQTISVDVGGQANRMGWVRKVKDQLRSLHSYEYFSSRFYSFQRTLSARQGEDREPASQNPENPVQSVLGYYDDKYSGWKDCKNGMKALAELSRLKKVPVVFAVVGGPGTVSPNRESDPWVPLLTRFQRELAQSGLPRSVYVDDAFRGSSVKDIRLREDDNHFSPEAHRLTGQLLHQYLRENGLVAAGPAG